MNWKLELNKRQDEMRSWTDADLKKDNSEDAKYELQAREELNWHK